ncbi:MAG: TRAP transporter small permease, partial [Moorellales bacterium]
GKGEAGEMSVFKRAVHLTTQGTLKVSQAAVLFLMFLTVGDVLGRFLFNRPITGTFELTEVVLAVAVFTSLAYGQAEKVYVTITFIYDRFPRLLRRLIDVLVYLVATAAFLLTFWQLFQYAERLARAGQYTTVLRQPLYPWVAVSAIGVLIFCLSLLWDLGQAVRRVDKGEIDVES